MTLAVIYSRISHDPEGRQAGVERQEQDCRQMATERGWVVLEPVYRENDVSASTRSKKRRPVFDRMLDDLAGRSAAVLLAYSTSRLTRRPLEYERLIDLTSRTGLEIHTVVPTANGGCAKIRIQADFVERFLLERIKERDDTALESVGQARIRASLRQLQDDHYDGLLDRADFLRQSQRLRVALTRPRGTAQARPVLTDPDKRALLTMALDRVIVLPHPPGRAASHLDWAQRSILLQDRLQLIWTT